MAEVEWEWVFDNTDAHHNHLPRTSVNCQLRFSGFATTPLLTTITYKNGETTHLRFTAEKMSYPLSELTWAELMDGYEQFLIVRNRYVKS